MKSASKDTIQKIIDSPTLYARMVGYNLLVPELHDAWIRKLMFSNEDYTLQAHRESYKTTCVIIAITLLMVLKPDESILLVRKDKGSVAEIARAILRNLSNPITSQISMGIHGRPIELEKETNSELHTTLSALRKESQFVGDGIRSFSITGKHFHRIFTDDIVTLKDRISKAERQLTDSVYQELQNVRMSGGNIINTGTPWHKDDTFRMMPEPEKWPVYDTSLMDGGEILQRKKNMTASLFSANYELKHIADSESMFRSPKYAPFPDRDSFAHIDCAYGGGDTIALTAVVIVDGNIHATGKVFTGHVQDYYEQIRAFLMKHKAGTLYNETNSDKGYFAKEFRRYWPAIKTYHENMNKHLKISTYLKRDWEDIYFDNDTDNEYINQIVDYQEGGEPDDAPDSLASLLREMGRGKILSISRGAFGL